jgi:hypothetical protein
MRIARGVADGLANASEPGGSPAELNQVLRKLGPRWFLVRDVHSGSRAQLREPRWSMSYLRGPMLQSELRRMLGRGRLRAVA